MFHSNVNLAAPIGALAFLGTFLLLLVLVLVSIGALITRSYRIFRLSLLAPVALLLVYFALMLGFSLVSSQSVLARGEEKYFCELDCHLAYSIVDVLTTPTVGSGPTQQTANGIFYVVTVRTRFDPTTIGPARGNSSLTPNPRSIAVLDSAGHKYQPSANEAGLQLDHAIDSPLTASLRPGESYKTVFVFDLPKNIADPVVLLNESEPLTRLIIGHENSFGHRKTVFRI